jgi:hypothetical protein
LGSLPSFLADEEGVYEALRHNAQAEADPDQLISLSELEAKIRKRS